MKKLAIKYGLMMFAGFTLFFLLMYLIGLGQNLYLRLFNGVIHMAFLALAIREYRKAYPDSLANYVSGVAMGMYASAIGVVGFTIFMLLFLSNVPEFMAHVQASVPIDQFINPFSASLFILVEGIAVSLIGSYILTRIIDMRMGSSQAWEKFRR